MVDDTHASPHDVVARVALRLVMSTDDGLDDVIVDALRVIGTTEGADRAYITMLDADGGLRNSHEWCAEGIPSQQDAIQRMQAADFPWSSAVAERGEVWNVGRLEDLPPEAAAEARSFGDYGVRSVLQVPMSVNGSLRGVVGFNHMRSPREWSDGTIDLVRSIAGAIGVALLRRDADREVRRARDQAERANRAKDELLSRVSHELRTPLHAILGFTELLRLEQPSSSARTSLDQIEMSGRRLVHIVDDMLHIGSVASGHLDVSLGPIPLRFVVEEALIEQRSLAASRGMRIVLGGGLAAVVRADPALLQHVLEQLVSNAVKYGSSGGLVEIDALAEGSRCRITVRDEGPGIAPEQIPEAFETFARLGAERSGEPGMGLGLTLARSLVEQMHGSLDLESAPGSGTTAIVTLPLALDV